MTPRKTSKMVLAILLLLTAVATTVKAATVEEMRKVLCPFERQLAERCDHGLYSGELLSALVDARWPEVEIKAVMRDNYSDAALLMTPAQIEARCNGSQK